MQAPSCPSHARCNDMHLFISGYVEAAMTSIPNENESMPVGTAADDSLAGALLRRHWWWLLGLAILQGLAGVAAIVVPPFASLVAVAACGWLLIIAGGAQISHALRVRRWRGFALSVLSGLLYVIAGVLTLLFPVSGVLVLALCLAALLIVDGIARIALAWRIRRHEGWIWLLVAGGASLVLGLLLIVGWPGAGVWALGLLLGMNLIIGGATNAALAMTCRERHRNAAVQSGGTPAAA